MKIKDIGGVDADGNPVMKPDGKIDGYDQVRLDKNRDPRFTGGININVGYKGFDLTILFQGATGGLLFIGTESGDIGNYLQYSYDHRWSIDNPSSVDPRLANRGNTYYAGGSYGLNTYWLRSSNYLRLKTLQLSYNLPPSVMQLIKLKSANIFLQGVNLFTFSPFKLWDVEIGNGRVAAYSSTKSYTAGIAVNF